MVRIPTEFLQLLVIFTVDCTAKMNSLGRVIHAQVHGIYVRKSRDYANLSTRGSYSKRAMVHLYYFSSSSGLRQMPHVIMNVNCGWCTYAHRSKFLNKLHVVAQSSKPAGVLNVPLALFESIPNGWGIDQLPWLKYFRSLIESKLGCLKHDFTSGKRYCD